ncbi:MAG: rRNA pseudouridine synthase [Gemmatimonadetes bacterium]|nr:rRNA pseudouridine synthase [Gemmatimonadota bacterium]
MTRMRLQRAIARAGVASRRRAEELISAGGVRVNGAVATLGVSVDPEQDTITVRGRRIQAGRIRWIALYKPVGYVVTRRDPEGRPTVFDLVPDIPGLTYVGRLDVATSGLLLLTSDGEAVHRLTHPRFRVERVYRVVVRVRGRGRGRTPDAIRRDLRGPIPVGGGRPVRLVRFQVRRRVDGASELTLVLTEGRHRIVRRLCEKLGLEVDRIHRLSHGPIRLGQLRVGRWRYLTKDEIRQLSADGSARSRKKAYGP